MKKFISLALSLTMAFALAVSASAANLYVDVDFGSDGTYKDAKGNAVLSTAEEVYELPLFIEDTTVTHAGKTYTVPAYIIDYARGGAEYTGYHYGMIGEIEALADKATFKEWYADGITYEMFVQYTGEFVDYDYSVVLMSNNYTSGQGFYLNVAPSWGCGDQPTVRWLTYSTKDGAYLYPYSTSNVSDELTHLIGTWNYDADTRVITSSIYVNGVLEGTSTSSEKSTVGLHAAGDWNCFGIGGNGTIWDGKDYPWISYTVDSFICTDAKIYQGGVSDDEAAAMYEAAVAALAAADTGAAKTETKEEVKEEVKEETKTETKEEVKEEVKEETKTETKEETKPATSVPKTGDATVIMAAMSALAGAGLCAVSFKKKED